MSKIEKDPKEMTDEEWRQKLSSDEYQILRRKGTERAGTGKLLHNKEEGTYSCKGCGAELFSSDKKYDSGSGWPSFYAPLENDNVTTKMDTSVGMVRTEILCNNCGGHLGHLFEDGPLPTGQRYCVNSTSLEFEKK